MVEKVWRYVHSFRHSSTFHNMTDRRKCFMVALCWHAIKILSLIDLWLAYWLVVASVIYGLTARPGARAAKNTNRRPHNQPHYCIDALRQGEAALSGRRRPIIIHCVTVKFYLLKVGVVRLRVLDPHRSTEECTDILIWGNLYITCLIKRLSFYFF